MNHQDAVGSQTAERYVLGQLRGGTRVEFEDHFFECEECAEAVRTGILFVDNAAAELQTAPVRSAQWQPDRQTNIAKQWFRFRWLTPAFATLALALAVVSGLWIQDHRRLHGELIAALAPQTFKTVPLEIARGGTSASVARDQRFFAISFYINPDSLPKYRVRISGNGAAPETIVLDQRQSQRYSILLPVGRFPAGRYDVTVQGASGTNDPIVEQFSLNLQ